MSEYAPSSAPGDAAVDPGSILTPDAIEAILQEFREWLHQAASRAAEGAPPPLPERAFSWHELAAEFTALRQEVNLQTRAARSQLEQNADALKQLDETVKSLDEAAGRQDTEDRETEALRPLLKTLVDIYDALALARREVQRTQAKLDDLLATATAPTDASTAVAMADSMPTNADRKRRWWRWGSSSAVSQSQPLPPGVANRLAQMERELAAMHQAEALRSQAADQARQVLSSILVGYTMSLQRIERALNQHELEPIACVGEPFDPECMEVVEVIAEPGRQETEVLKVRRGYLWRGRLFRFAQVRVAKPR